MDVLIRRVAVLAAALVVLGTPHAEAQLAAAVPINNYATPVILVVDRSQPTYFVNADIAGHDVVARDVKRTDVTAHWCLFRETSCPMFWTDIIGLGEVVPIEGLDEADPGVPYTFYCTDHPWMTGILVVAQ